MKLQFLLARRDSGPSQIVIDATAALERRGFEVESTIPEEALLRSDLLEGGDRLWLLKSYGELALAVAATLHARGARILNPYPASISARNKIVASRILSAAGVPAPRTWVTGDLELVRPILREHAVVVKPSMGWRGEGVAIVRDERELRALPRPTSPVVVQELLPGTGEDLRVYVAGEEIFATRKPFSASSFAVPGRPVAVTREIRALARRCGEAFGLALYGLDVLETPRGPFVVDVNTFPGYKGCAGAAEAVADTIERYATGRRDLARLATPGRGAAPPPPESVVGGACR
jgi:ribosomal protein S6--L-glutamate ligase